jgi:hypothetical protein
MCVLEVVTWIFVAQVRDRSQALLKAVMKLRVPQNGRNFLTSYGTSGVLKSIGSMD